MQYISIILSEYSIFIMNVVIIRINLLARTCRTVQKLPVTGHEGDREIRLPLLELVLLVPAPRQVQKLFLTTMYSGVLQAHARGPQNLFHSKTCAASFTTEEENLRNLRSLRHQAISTQENTGNPVRIATIKHTRKFLSFPSNQKLEKDPKLLYWIKPLFWS